LVDRTREFEVRVPPGSTSGSIQRVAGEGSPGRRGGVSGDLHVIVRVRPHPFYGREGDTLSIEVPISMAEAALGADIEVPVLDGVVRMKVPPGTQSGSVFRLRGKGIPRPAGGRGDAHVRVVVETPNVVGREAAALLAKLDELLGEAATPRRRELLETVRRQAASAARGVDESEGTVRSAEPLRGEPERAPREPS
jgi:molecular chaperone DnaJ